MDDVTRVALLGATGSIGRQALAVIAAHPTLEICALASASQPLDEHAAAHGAILEARAAWVAERGGEDA